MKKLLMYIKENWYYLKHKDNLGIYIELMSHGMPLPKEWMKDAERLAKAER